MDRRLRVIEAPGFGIVGRGVELRLMVEDLGVPAGSAAPLRLTIRRDGAAPRTESVLPGREHRIAVPIERGGPSVIEITAEERPGEVSTLNNTRRRHGERRARPAARAAGLRASRTRASAPGAAC